MLEAGRATTLPVLRKDFIIDPYQLLQAKAWGADAVLLIAACLDRQTCREMVSEAHALGLEVLLEIHDPSELAWLSPDVDMLGVNNRNLGTFVTDTGNSFRLAGMLSSRSEACGHPLLVSESGISDPSVIARLRKAGYRGFLIGEAFMSAPYPGEALRGFISDIA